MALDNEYFDSINIEIAKKKYYNAGKVNAVLADIRARAQMLNEENAQLREKLESVTKGRNDISETLLTAHSFSKSITDGAEQQAAQIIADAEKRAAEIIAEAEKRAAETCSNSRGTEEYAVNCVRESYDALRESLLAQLDAVNSGWENFLANINAETAAEVPEDLSAKVGAIAGELFSFDDDE